MTDPTLDNDADDLGEPVAELRLLRDDVPAGFLDRIRNSIHRRSLAGDLTRFSIWAPATVFLEFLASLFDALGRPGGNENDTNGADE